MFYFDPIYIIFLLPGLLIGIVAQILLKVWTSTYQNKAPLSGLTGADIVEKIAKSHNFNISLDITDKHLGDHYDPRSRTVALSREVATRSSITSLAIAAHEMGHVEQHFKGSSLMKFRNVAIPVTNFSTNIGYFLLIMGIALGFANLSWLGIVLFSASVVITLVTLPIEFDASRRAAKLLLRENILVAQEIPGVKKVLSAAALTYVAATVQSIATLAYFILRVQGIKRS